MSKDSRKANIERRLNQETYAKDKREAAWLVVRSALEDSVISMTKLEASTPLTKLGMDSLDKVEVLMCLEDDFNVEIPYSEAEAWKTGDDIINYLLKEFE